MKSGNYCILCTDQKNSQKISKKVWSTLFKNGNNISALTWNTTYNLPDGSYSISNIQNYFEFIIKRHYTLTENPPIKISPNKIENITVFKVKTGYKLELLSLETIKQLESTKKIKIKMEKMYQN